MYETDSVLGSLTRRTGSIRADPRLPRYFPSRTLQIYPRLDDGRAHQTIPITKCRYARLSPPNVNAVEPAIHIASTAIHTVPARSSSAIQ